MQQKFFEDRASITRWVRACLVLFFVAGLGFGTWLSRLPTLRDDLGASMVQMSVYGLCLAAGSLSGLVFAGPLIERLQPRRTMSIMIAVLVVTLPGAAALLAAGFIVLGLAVLFVFGFCFSTTDIAMNVSGANGERAERRSRMPLLHAGYSIGSVISMLLGAAAERLGFALLPHFIVVSAIITVCALIALPKLPKNETELRMHDERATPDTAATVPVIESAASDELSTITASIPVVSAPRLEDEGAASRGDSTGSARKYSPWRDKRIAMIGVITLVAGLLEGTPADWLPLAIVDGRGVSNEFGTMMLGVFFTAVVASRLMGSLLLARFGRIAVLRTSIVVAALGVLLVSLVPGPVAMVAGAIAWGLGTGLCWPITISASADNPRTAVRDVAAVSAIGYTSLVLGPMVFGFLGEAIGLLEAFLVLPAFAVVALLLAGAARAGARSEGHQLKI